MFLNIFVHKHNLWTSEGNMPHRWCCAGLFYFAGELPLSVTYLSFLRNLQRYIFVLNH